MTNKRIIKIDQAFYGELDQGHGCLYSTIDNISLKAHLTGFTDRPGSLSAGTELKPYYSGMKYDEYYIFTLTFPDDNATRGGIVFTHALILNIDDIQYVNNLEYLFDLFCKEIPENRASLEQLHLEESYFKVSVYPKVFPEYTVKSIQMLSSGVLPIIFCGDAEKFIKLIASIWCGLSKSFRSKLSFTAGFMVSNMDTTKTFIHFQKDLSDTLRNVESISDNDSEEVEVKSTIEKFILNPHGDNRFEAFLSELHVNVNSWNSLHLTAKAYEGYSVFSELDKDALKQLLRQVAKVSPNYNKGYEIKENLISALAWKIENGEETNLKSLRNLPLESYDSGEKKIGSAVKFFVENEFEVNINFNDTVIAEAISVANDDPSQNWWHQQVIAALNNGIRAQTVTSIKNLWKLILKSDDSFRNVWKQIPTTSDYENVLIKHLPMKISQFSADAIVNSSKERKWTMLHAYMLLTYLPSEEALLKQYYFEKDLATGKLQGTELIIVKVLNSDLLSLILEYKEDFFVNEYVKRALKDKTLLNGLDVTNESWQYLWSLTLEQTNDLEYGIIDLSEKIEFLLNQISVGENISEVITIEIAKSQYADISGLENRAQFWKYISPKLKEFFLNATSYSILKDISIGGLSGFELESELTNHIATDRFMTDFLSKYRADLNTVLEVYEYIPRLKDKFLSDYIKNYSGSLKDMQSERLGNLVKSKAYRDSARQIFEKAKNDDSYQIALEKCRELISLGFLDLLFHGNLFGRRITKDDIYSEVNQICIALYPEGPEDSDLWQRAGGDISKLYQNHSREENWRTAIRLLRNGGGGKDITIKSLLNVMIEDFPRNTQLKHILKAII